MPNLGPPELLIIAGVLVLLFGATKLPKLARSLGESARIFKAETTGMRDDAEDRDSRNHREEPGSATPLPSAQRPERSGADTAAAQSTPAPASSASTRASKGPASDTSRSSQTITQP